MNLDEVATEISVRLGTILNNRTTPYAPDTITAPAGYVFGPESTPHQSYANGLTMLKLSVTVAVARAPLSVSYKALAGYTSDSGPTSVRALLESGDYESFHTLIVARSIVGDVTIGDVLYRAAEFDLEITGSGA